MNRLDSASGETVRVVATADTDDFTVQWNDGEYGWYMDLPDRRERVIVPPIPLLEFVFFNTMVPGVDTCGDSSRGFLMAVPVGNGGAPDRATTDLNDDGELDENDQVTIENETSFPVGVQVEGTPLQSQILQVANSDQGRQLTPGVGGPGGGPGEVRPWIDSPNRTSWQEINRE